MLVGPQRQLLALIQRVPSLIRACLLTPFGSLGRPIWSFGNTYTLSLGRNARLSQTKCVSTAHTAKLNAHCQAKAAYKLTPCATYIEPGPRTPGDDPSNKLVTCITHFVTGNVPPDCGEVLA